ncbi:NCS1 family transporter [Selenomonas sp. TAMA-11512]|uniref:NCS1 family transporter n=1 Tax=Selenomonas sp. TAMA-11512 TaxID=3095337 RepID=UPI00309046F9|nr:NCS1 family transporter [Selenomonas sp. TAMA-11512]
MAEMEHESGLDTSLLPKKESERKLGKLAYMSLWLGDGVNLGNMTLGSSLVVAGVAMMNIYQTFVAAAIAISIISIIFSLNDRLGYKSGIPYVVHLRMSFGVKGSIVSSLLRGIPALVWYGFQSWIGATALNEISKIVLGIDQPFVMFVILQVVQIGLSLYGFHAIKWVESVISTVIMLALVYVLFLLITEHSAQISTTWVHAEGTWGIEFWGFIMAFMGNYAAIFLSAADYSRELRPGIGNGERSMLYFFPIILAYGTVLCIGAMLASVTGVSNPAKAIPILVNNPAISVFISAFIVMGAIAVNMVANIVPPTYVITLLTKMNYKAAVTLSGILAACTFPWVLVQDSSAVGLTYFILIYSAFLGPIVAILLIEYYILRQQKVDIDELYRPDGEFAGYNKAAIVAMLIGAAAAFVKVELAWVIGLVVAGIAYYILMGQTEMGAVFRKGTIFEKKE